MVEFRIVKQANPYTTMQWNLFYQENNHEERFLVVECFQFVVLVLALVLKKAQLCHLFVIAGYRAHAEDA